MQGRRMCDEYPVYLLEPGDYVKVSDHVGRYSFYGMTPNGLTCNLQNHQVVEHSDRTITVCPSILCKDHKEQWHGYLEAGRWNGESKTNVAGS